MIFDPSISSCHAIVSLAFVCSTEPAGNRLVIFITLFNHGQSKHIFLEMTLGGAVIPILMWPAGCCRRQMDSWFDGLVLARPRQNKVIRRLQLGTGCQQEKVAGTCLLIWSSCRDQALADRFVGSAAKAKDQTPDSRTRHPTNGTGRWAWSHLGVCHVIGDGRRRRRPVSCRVPPPTPTAAVGGPCRPKVPAPPTAPDHFSRRLNGCSESSSRHSVALFCFSSIFPPFRWPAHFGSSSPSRDSSWCLTPHPIFFFCIRFVRYAVDSSKCPKIAVCLPSPNRVGRVGEVVVNRSPPKCRKFRSPRQKT